MGGMYVLEPAPEVRRPPYRFVALAARRTDDGLLADVQVLNGDIKSADPKWGDAVVLSTEAQRDAASLRIAPTITLKPPAIADALLELHLATEGAVRAAAEEPEWPEPAPFWQVAAPPFPIKALLVPAIQRFVQEVSRAFETPTDFAGMGVLSALSGAIGNRRRIHIVGEIYAGAGLWGVIIGKPGTGKSDPVERALQPIIDLHDKRIKEYLEAKEKFDDDLTEWENTKREDRDAKPKPPAVSRLMVADHTIEALAVDLASNPLGMVLYRDELATWLAGFDKYRQAGTGSDRANWLEIWRSHRIDVSRKTGTRVIYVPRPFVTVIGTIQPERLHELLGRLDDGFADRLLCVYPVADVAPLPVRGINPETSAAYEQIIKDLLAMQLDDEGKAPTAELTGKALARFRERAAALDDAMREPGLAPALAGSFAKMRIYSSRMTCILHNACVAAGLASPYQATEEHVNAAWDLVEYWQGHQRTIHAAKMADPEASRATDILELLARKGWARFSRRDVYRYKPTRFTRPEDAEPALRLLCDQGYIREVPMPERSKKGRPPTQVYDVNPRWDSRNSQFRKSTSRQRDGQDASVRESSDTNRENDPAVEEGGYVEDDF